MRIRESQKKAILRLLKCKKVVSLPELMDLKVNGMRVAGITARVSDLRDDGCVILNRKKFDRDKGCYISEYKLRGNWHENIAIDFNW